METDYLPQAVVRFLDALEARQINYLLVGGIAMLQYVKGRNTEDLDVIAAASALEALPAFEVTERDANFVRGTFEMLRVDVLLPRNALFERVRKDFSTTHEFLERRVPCATVEGLILLKLYALPSLYRQGDFTRVGLYENDVATLLFHYEPELTPIFNLLDDHLSASDAGEVRRIVADLRQRIQRFGDRSEGDA